MNKPGRNFFGVTSKCLGECHDDLLHTFAIFLKPLQGTVEKIPILITCLWVEFGKNLPRSFLKFFEISPMRQAKFSNLKKMNEVTATTHWITTRNFNFMKQIKYFQLLPCLLKFFKWKMFCPRTRNYQTFEHSNVFVDTKHQRKYSKQQEISK